MASQSEQLFNRFVESIGGTVLPKGALESADYLFRSERIVSELKILERDARDEHVRKLLLLAQEWGRRGQVRVYGTTVVDLQRSHPQVQREWLHLLESPLEGVVRKAHGQIRSSKENELLPDAKGLLIIMNDGNLLHTTPVEFMTLIARILQKRTPDGQKKFPHIRGVVYFSYRVPMAGESKLFWIAGTMEPALDVDLNAFQNRLRREWVDYFAQLTGRPVTEDLRTIPNP